MILCVAVSFLHSQLDTNLNIMHRQRYLLLGKVQDHKIDQVIKILL